MAASTIPFSNPAGNNQTNPISSVLPKPTSGTGTSGVAPIPGGPVQAGANPVAQNPYTPPTPIAAPTPTLTGGYATNVAPITPGGVVSNNLQTQLTDIYGQGVGASLFNLLNNSSGTDSTVLQEFIQSLAPQEATASANVNATLGAGGVSANSSVNAIAQSNLQAQEFSTISGESAQLTESNQQLDASVLQNMEGAATSEVSASGWNVLGDVLSGIGQDAGGLMTGIGSLGTASSLGKIASSVV
jgi:hypothetical protein